MLDDWQVVSEIPKLSDDEVQVWRIDLDDETQSEDDYREMLSAEEAERASRLRAGQVRMQFLVGRSFVRTLLGAELRVDPKSVSIVTGKYGKPELNSESGVNVQFNVAHSRSTVLVAVSRTKSLGIDIEYLDRETDVLEVARHSLTARETSFLQAIGEAAKQHRAFFEFWTRKEAVVKADGRGLCLPLNSFEVPAGLPCQFLPLDIQIAEENASRRYFVSDIAFDEVTACAIAVADRRLRLRLLTLQTPRPTLKR